jgi:N6-adenosine-specific RNA methylase IME4
MKKYKTILADPPWMEQGGGKIKRGADRHYPLMKTKDIIALPIRELAEENAHLYLWVTNNFLPDGLKAMAAWGFEYKTTITWVKDRIGLGQYFRGITEHCLFGVRGNLPYKVIDGVRQQGKTIIEAPKTIHSEKPEEMRKMIEAVSYQPYIELFARTKANERWDVWGNQLINDIELNKQEELFSA